MQISDDIKIVEWFANSEFSEGTQAQYLRRMEIFCSIANKTPTELIVEAITETKQGLLPSERKNFGYIARFKTELNKRNYSPKAMASAVAAVKSFYKVFDIQLSSRIKIKRAVPRRENRNFLKKEDVKKLIDNAANLRDRAIILTMATSGMARKEIINLKIKDIVVDSNKVGTISMRRKKNDIDFITFISPEAVDAINLYWESRNRDRGGILKIKDNNDYTFVSVSGKQLNTNTFTFIFRTLAAKLGYKNINGKGYQIICKSHALRKFFASTLEDAGLPRKKIEFMIAHSLTDNEIAYYQNETKKLKELYIDYLKYITFNSEIIITNPSERITELEKEVKQLEEAVKTLDASMCDEPVKTKEEIKALVDAMKDET